MSTMGIITIAAIVCFILNLIGLFNDQQSSYETLKASVFALRMSMTIWLFVVCLACYKIGW